VITHHLLYNLRVSMNAPLLDHPVSERDPIAPVDLKVTVSDWAQFQEWLKQTDWATDPNRQTGEAGFAMFTGERGCDSLHRFDFVNSTGGRVIYVTDEAATELRLAWQVRDQDETGTLRAVGELFYGRVLGYLLRLRGRICLHGAAVAAGGKALGFLGAAGTGKSTLTAALVARGYPLVADDRIVMVGDEKTFWVQTGRPSMRLWPRSLDAVNLSAERFPTVYPGTEKRSLSLFEPDSPMHPPFRESALQLGALYILAPRDARLQLPSVQPLKLQSALRHLLKHRYGSRPPMPAVVAFEYHQLARLVRQIPVRIVQRPDDLETLPHLAQAILDDWAQISPAAPEISSSTAS
jgi:hypothetical protein